MNLTNVSPDGRYELRFSGFEVRMSHWIEQPYLVRVSDQSCLFSLHFLWSLDEAHWLSPSTVTMHIRLYPGSLSCVVTLDVDANQGTAKTSDGNVYSGSLAKVSAWVDALANPKKRFFSSGWPKQGLFAWLRTSWRLVLARPIFGRRKPG